ncbi:Uncharacterised protein [Mycobacterium tuberculosis]|uniref:Uncharacterized protein n=1 Tax=Mycobacterium tuberculosis TaxID=1773 RepID=A0A654U6F0_MYCTX|nr:Uncharacterised protein [Mycobacterium tuberculosis]CNW75293.1 Uncharacterised protein [Mycobacterium tuberculosis]
MRPMNACSIARISSLRASVIPATERIRSKSAFSVFGVLTSSRTAANLVWFPPILPGSTNGVDGPYGLRTHLPEEVFMAGPALAADADPDRSVEQNRPPHLMPGADLSIGHRGPAGSDIGGVEVDEYPGR